MSNWDSERARLSAVDMYGLSGEDLDDFISNRGGEQAQEQAAEMRIAPEALGTLTLRSILVAEQQANSQPQNN